MAAKPSYQRGGRDLYLAMVGDRINDTMRFLDTLVMLCMDSYETLPPRGKHLIWLRLASEEPSALNEMGLPLDDHGGLVHWGGWPNELGDYAQAQALRLARAEQRDLEPRNVAMASALSQAAAAERTAASQVELAHTLVQLVSMGANPRSITELMRQPNSPSIRPIVDALHEQAVAQEQAQNQSREPWDDPEGQIPIEDPNGPITEGLAAELERITQLDNAGQLDSELGLILDAELGLILDAELVDEPEPSNPGDSEE